MSVKDFLNLITALVISIGGTSVIILALAKWFGGFLSERLLAKYKSKHEKELEELKSIYKKELEKTKNELEKAKTLFLRYSEQQFELYNNLWRVLQQTKRQADDLWESPKPEKVQPFAEQVSLTRKAIEDSMLLIEDWHFKELNILLTQFENFKIGKDTLMKYQYSNSSEQSIITQHDIEQAVSINSRTRLKYNRLISGIGNSFRKQIKG